MQIQFNPDGTATALYTEEIDLTQLGTMTMRRASVIEWHEQKQVWQVWLATLPRAMQVEPIYENKSRVACVEWEQSNLA